MKTTSPIKRILSALLVFVMVLTLMPIHAHAATSGNEANTIFFATDRHGQTSKLQSLLKALAYTPGLVVLGGDYVDNTNKGSLASITAEIQSVYPGVQTFYTYAAHDPNVSADSSNPYAYARTGEVYEGNRYYVYAVDQNDMQSSSSAATASAKFKTWANSADPSKVIFVICHMPIHKRRGDNAGGATWMNALNEVGKTHDIVYLWGHNHTGESSADTSVFYVSRGGSLTPQGGSKGTINFTYVNAGYIKNGYATMAVVNNDSVTFTRYNTSGSVVSTNTMTRQFAAHTHIWQASETVDATCAEDGSVTYTCACGDTYTEVTPATGHSYNSVVTAPTCTEGGYTTYTCACGHSYTADETAALGHSYKSVTVDATCEENGSITYTCDCGDTYTEAISAIGHNYESVVTAPTCTEGGYTTYTCDTCGDSYTADEVAALGHAYESVVTAPTCETVGYTTYTCTTCGHSYTADEVAALGHSYEAVVTAPTCTEVGYTTYTCACGHSYVANEVAALGHDYQVKTVNATCEEDGSITYTCFCGDTYTEIIPALGHDYETVTVNATCESDGSVTTTCATCGETTVEVIPALGHSYTAVVTAPTCTEGGYTTYTCACGHSYTADEVAALGHTYEPVTVDATCAKDGYTTYTCACGDTYTVTIPATGEHVYVAETVEATCTKNGSITYTCDCGASYEEVIPATGHSFKAVVTAPTCETVGYTTYACACGDSYIADEVAALGHDYEAVVTAPTCAEDGYTTYTCACGDTYVADVVAALGHDYEAVVTAPTCETVGYTTYTCACGDSYTADEVAALGHDYEAVVTAPTCETVGYTTYTCACGHSYVDDQVAALGHDYESVSVEATCENDGSVTTTCATCGETTVEVIPALGHDYEIVTVNATCTTEGSVTTTCTNCGDSDTQIISAIGHNYETVTVEATCTTEGSVTTTCTNCGDTTVEVIPALGHDYEAVVTAPTCETVGYTTYTCACGHSYTADEVAALGHDYNAVVTAPTCTEAGYTTYTCACGDTYTADATAALGHRYTTEEVNGYLVYTCVCGDTYSESIGWIKLPGSYVLDTDGIEIGSEHKYVIVGANKDYALTLSGNTIGAAKVTVNGNTITLENASAYEFYFVNNNSKERGSYLLTQNGKNSVYHMGGNMYYGTDNKGYWHIGSSSKGSYQLYDNDNSKWYLNYGYVWGSDSVSRFAVSSSARYVRLFKAVDSYVRLSGETSQTWVHGAATTESAVLEKVLIQTSTDGSNVSGTAAVTASMITWDKAFDGYTAGTYTATVTYNGESIGIITVTVTGEHIYETVVVAPTCTKVGYTTYTCDCGHSYTADETAALGHHYTAVEDNGYMVYTCGNCSHSYSEKLTVDMSYDKVTKFTNGDSYVITVYSNKKYYALSHENNKITAVQVTVSNNEITSEITEDMLWAYNNKKLSYENGNKTYYLYVQSGSSWWNSTQTLTVSTSNSSTVSFSSSKLKVGSYYLRYSGGTIKLDSSSTTTYLFVETEE